MFAVIELGGHQYIVKKGDTLEVEKVDAVAGKDFKIEKVLAIANENEVNLGKPYISGAFVSAQFIEDFRGKKVLVFRYRPKKRYRKLKGHRQTYSKIEILDIKA